MTEPGNYYVTWWVMVDGAGPATEIIFSIDVVGSLSIPAASMPGMVSLQLNGSALITVTSGPTIVSLVNKTGEDAALANNSVQASMIILQTTL